MALIKFLRSLIVFVGVLASAAAVVAAGYLMMKFPALLLTFVLACLIFNQKQKGIVDLA